MVKIPREDFFKRLGGDCVYCRKQFTNSLIWSEVQLPSDTEIYNFLRLNPTILEKYGVKDLENYTLVSREEIQKSPGPVKERGQLRRLERWYCEARYRDRGSSEALDSLEGHLKLPERQLDEIYESWYGTEDFLRYRDSLRMEYKQESPQPDKQEKGSVSTTFEEEMSWITRG